MARDVAKIRQVRAWAPQGWKILLCAFHLTHYCTVVLDDLEKLDLAIFSAAESPANWVVHDYTIIKGDDEFEAQLARAAEVARSAKAAHRNPDVSIDNILLLMITAWKRVQRGELLSAHAFLAMAADMLICLERRSRILEADADVLDPRRRLEKNHGELARGLQDCLFGPPGGGIQRLGEYLGARHRGSMTTGQIQTLEHLANV